jgi:hypothetical protein
VPVCPEHAAVVEVGLALATAFESAILVCNPAHQNVAHLGAIGVTTDANGPLITTDGARVLLDLLQVALHVDLETRSSARSRVQSASVMGGRQS